MKRELIHTRKITVNWYETEGERLIVEGSLTDERYYPCVIHTLNEDSDAGKIHHILLTMEISIPLMKILSLTVDMPTVPDAGCRDIKEVVQSLVGHRVRPGFTNDVKKLLGKEVGCLHLTNLVLWR